MTPLNPPSTSLRYLAKLMLGLSILGGVVLMSLDPSIASGLGLSQTIAFLACLLIMLALAPLVFIFYRRMDELNRHLHHAASAISLPILASVSGILGVLQSHGFIPSFNQFWLLGGTIALWAVALVLSDRRFR